ncbi:MAG: NUDIX hydrolase [Maritimibacter sp.]
MIRRYGTAKLSDTKYRLRRGVYAILPRDGQLLVTHQEEPEPEFQLPGGGIDPGESPLTALHREVIEETGWRIANPRRLGAFRRFTYMPEYDLWAEKLCIIYICHPVRQISDPTEPGHSAHWVSPRLAEEIVGNPGDSAFINAFV